MSKGKSVKAGTNSKRLRMQILVIVVVILYYVICNFVTGGKLFDPDNIRVILTSVSFPLIVSLGMVFVFSGGIVDLSIGAQIILAANVGAIFVENFGMGYPGLIIGAIVTIIICQVASAACSVFLGIPSWVAGLGAALVFEAIAAIIIKASTDGTAVVYMESCKEIGSFPSIFIVAIVIAIVAWIIFNRTKLGFNLRAIGGGGEVAEAMGINKKKTIILACIVGAIIVGFGAIVQVSYSGSFKPSAGMGSLTEIFKPLAILMISGSFARIFNDIVGCIVGSFIVAGLFNVLTMLGVTGGTGQDICLGIVVLVCGIFSSLGYKGVVK